MDYFPINIAQGEAFCNRFEERKLLKQWIDNGRHAVIIAPRRYGKTSLINQTLIESKLPYSIMELTMAVRLQDVEKIIIKHVAELLYSILPASKKVQKQILSLFKWLNPEIALTAHGQKISFQPDWNKVGEVHSIAEILQKLDEAAQLTGKRVVIVMDEFQQLSDIGGRSQQGSEFALEAAIRNAMQYSQNTSYLFSGSHRQMLLHMFNSKSRPFYNSCEVMAIERIEKNEYAPFIQKAAIEQWKCPLDAKVLDRILALTELHPHYVNRLCGHFWLTQKQPTLQNVEEYWQKLVQSKRSEFTEDLLNLSKNQRKMMSYLANNPESHPSSIKACTATGISETSIRQAIKSLYERDYIA